MDKKTNSNAALKPLWILNDWLRLIKTSNLPVDQEEIEKLLNPPLESAELVKKIFRDRILQVEKSNLITTTVGTTDFLSVSFLPKAVKRSLAVCRILQNFSRQEFIQLIEYAQGLNESQNFDTPQKVQEIFSIPAQYATDIFGDYYSNSTEEKTTPLEQLKSYIVDVHNELAENRLAKLNPFAIGTGFLVGGNHLLTNQHVLPTQEVARRCIAQFNYAEGEEGNVLVPVEYEFDPEALFVSNEDLDYTLIELRNNLFKKQAGYEFGWIELVEFYEGVAPGISSGGLGKLGVTDQSLLSFLHASSTDVEPLGYSDKEESIPGDPVIIVQHPRGRRKQVVVTNNRVTDNGLYKNFLRYTADSEPGASGSPVFNTKWQLIALNHASIPDLNGEKIVAEQGIRSCRIIADLKLQSEAKEELQLFLKEFVVTAEQLDHPPLPQTLKFNGRDSFVELIEFSDCKPIDNQVEEDAGVSRVLLASATSNGEIQLWGEHSSKPIRIFKAHDEAITCLSFSPDGDILASASNDGKVKLWNLEEVVLGTLKPKILEHGDSVRVCCICFNPKDKSLASGGDDGNIRIWNLESSTAKLIEHDRSMAVLSLCISPDGSKLASTASSHKIKLWDWQSNQSLHSFEHVGAISGSIFLGNDVLATVGKQTESWTLLGGEVWVKNFPPIGGSFHVSFDKATIQLWHLSDYSLMKTIEDDSPIVAHISERKILNSIALSSNGQYATLNWDDGNITLISQSSFLKKEESESPKISQLQRKHSVKVNTTQFILNGQAIISADQDGVLNFWNLNDQIFKSLVYEKSLITVSCNPKLDLTSLKVEDPYSFISAGQLSIEVWINPSSDQENITSLSGKYYSIISKSNAETIEYELGLYRSYQLQDSFQVNFRAYGKRANLKAGPIAANKFSHIAAVYNGQVCRVYINGVEVPPDNTEFSKEASSSSYEYQSGSLFLPFLVGAQPKRLGPIENKSDIGNCFNGRITDIRLWKKSLDAEDIKANMYQRLSGGEENLVGYWKFEDGESDHVYSSLTKDFHSIKKHGTIRNPQWLNARNFPHLPFPVGHYCTRESYIQCENINWSSNDNDGVITAVTVEVWVKHLFGNVTLLSQGGIEGESGYSLSWFENKVRVLLQNITSPNTRKQEQPKVGVFETTSYAPSDQVWHHIAFTWSKDTAEVELYVDGVRQNSLPIQGESEAIAIRDQYKSVGKFSSSLFTEAFNPKDPKIKPILYIGRGSEENTNFQCCISEVRLWRKARTQEQIRRNMYRRLEYLLSSRSDSNNSIDCQKEDLVAYWRLDDGGKANTRVRNLISDDGYGEIQGQAKWFPEPSEIIKEPDEQSPEN